MADAADPWLADSWPGVPAADPGPTALWRLWWQSLPADDEPMITARRQGFVLTTLHLDELGFTRAARRTAVRTQRWTAPARGVIAPFRVEDGAALHAVRRRHHVLRATAATLGRDDHIISARSAAIVRGLPTMRVPESAELTAPNTDGLGKQNPTHSYGALLFDYSVECWYGVLITSVARTLVDLARHDRRDAIMAADAALREGLVTRAEIEEELPDAIGWPGVRQAREVLALADPRAESPLESITRLALHDDNFPRPEPQFWIGADRVDFYWPKYGLVLEADGRGKYTDDALWDEKKREARLRVFRQVGAIERVVWSDVTRNWPETSARLRRHFTR